MIPPPSPSSSWQIILADLSLILFVTTLAALASAQARDTTNTARKDNADQFAVAQGQSLFRRRENGIGFAPWLEEQIPDPRQRLTIFVRHRPDSQEAIWREVRGMEREAIAAGYSPRLIIETAEENDIYASLVFDGVQVEAVSALRPQ